jgi:hypothetical protein
VTAVVSRVVPNALLELVSIEDVLDFRSANKKNLNALRAQMTALAERLTAQVGGDDLDLEVEALVKREIVPLVNNIDGELQQSRDKFFRTALSKIGSSALKASAAALPTLSLATYFGASPSQIVLYSAASLITGLGLALPDFVEHIKVTALLCNRTGSFRNSKTLKQSHTAIRRLCLKSPETPSPASKRIIYMLKS